MYNDNISNNLKLILAPLKRKLSILAFLAPPLKPLINLWQSFQSYSNAVSEKININYQVISLEYGLNKKFNSGNPGIYISDAYSLDQKFVWRKIENRKVYIYRKADNKASNYFYTRADYLSDNEFIINVPVTLIFNNNEMIAYVNQYKVAGFRFKIVTY